MMLEVLLITALPLHVSAYKILMIPLPAKSHIFSMAAIAEGLVKGGHKVTLLIGENYQVNLPELRNRPEISIVRYRDMTNGVPMDYDAIEENLTDFAIESRSNVKQLASAINKMYVNFTLTLNLQISYEFAGSHRPGLIIFTSAV